MGESGSGKSVTALSIMRLIEQPGEIVDGSIEFDGTDLVTLSDAKMRAIRGNEISMIFQDPMTSLNPVYRVGKQIGEALRCTRGSRRSRRSSAPWSCSIWSASPIRTSGRATTRTSSPAACASAR